MKKTVSIFAMIALVAVSSAGWALPPVTLAPDCDVVSNQLTGFDALASTLFIILGGLDIEGLPATWQEADLENGFAGDGVPDAMQLGMLGALLCSGNATVQGQYAANQAAYLALVGDVQDIFTDVNTLIPAIDTAGDNLLAWLDEPQAVLGDQAPRAVLAAQDIANIEGLANGMIAAADEVGEFVGTYGSLLPLLSTYSPVFAGLGGLSTEMSDTFTGLINNDLLGAISDVTDEMAALRDGALAIAAGVPTPPMTTEIAAELNDVASGLNDIIAAFGAVSLSDFEIYNDAKTASEPLSGLCDYNGNGDTNAEVYQSVVVQGGGSRADFVAAATGADPYYEGNPALPVAGLLGLSLLAGAFSVAGAMVIRKK
jgi:hypothetical protein